MKIFNEKQGVVFSNKEKQQKNSKIISKYDRRINDLLHKIEFTNATQSEAFKMYMKLQSFLRKKRALKPHQGSVYIPRTETGNYIVNGKVTKRKRKESNDGD